MGGHEKEARGKRLARFHLNTPLNNTVLHEVCFIAGFIFQINSNFGLAKDLVPENKINIQKTLVRHVTFESQSCYMKAFAIGLCLRYLFILALLVTGYIYF